MALWHWRAGLNETDSSITLSCPQPNQIGIDIDRTLPTLLVAAVAKLTNADDSAPPQLTINPAAAAIVQLFADDIPAGTGDDGGGPEIVCIHANRAVG